MQMPNRESFTGCSCEWGLQATQRVLAAAEPVVEWEGREGVANAQPHVCEQVLADAHKNRRKFAWQSTKAKSCRVRLLRQ